MNQLIKIASATIDGVVVQTVNARELHSFLEAGTAFKDWFPRRTKEYGFTQDVDFVISFLSVDDGGDGRHQYHISIDMAKELSMVERNAKGKEARQYFLECERRAKSLIPQSFAQALRLAADQQELIERQSLQIESAKPAVEFLDRFVEAKSTKGFREVAKVLSIKEKEFIGQLIEDGVIFRQSGRLLPKAEYQHRGLFEVKTGEANGHAFVHTKFTPAGIAWVAQRYAAGGV